MIEKLEDMAIGWPVLAPLIGFVVWLSGVNYRTLQNGRAIRKESRDRAALEARLAAQRAEDMRQNEAARGETNRSLAVISEDIKQLLARR